MTTQDKLVKAIKLLLGIMQDYRYGRTTYEDFCFEYDKIEQEILMKYIEKQGKELGG